MNNGQIVLFEKWVDYPLIGHGTPQSQKSQLGPIDILIKNVILTNFDIIFVIYILGYNIYNLLSCPYDSWLESYDAFKVTRTQFLKCQSQKSILQQWQIPTAETTHQATSIPVSSMVSRRTQPYHKHQMGSTQWLKTRRIMMEMRIMSADFRPSWESHRSAPVSPNCYCSF